MTAASSRHLSTYERPAKALLSPLTPRQEEIARLVGEGRSYKAIAARCGISRRTVERHVHRMAKLVGDAALTPYRRVQLWVYTMLDNERLPG